MNDWKSALRSNPIPWLLDNACAPIRYRVLTELLDRGRDDPDVQEARQDVIDYAPAKKLAKSQLADGTWKSRVHGGDPRKWEESLETNLSMLLESGWNRDQAEVRLAAKTLRSFLTVKKSLPLFEFQKLVKADPVREQYYRWFLRIMALGLLIRSGYGEDRSNTAVLELLDLCSGFVDNPVSRAPTEEIGAALPLIRAKVTNRGYSFIPDLYILRVLAFSPWLIEGELAKMRLRKIADYIVSPTYQKMAPELGLVRTSKGTFAKGNGIIIHPLDYYQTQGNVDELMMILELFGRLGLINRYPQLIAHFDWLHGLQEKNGRWNLPTKLINESSRWAHLLRIERDWRSPARKEADLTFRMLLILKNQWERQVLMLDRFDDGYPI